MEDSVKYLTYSDYQELGGTLDLMSFNLLELKSRKQIDHYTFGRLMNGVPADIKSTIDMIMYTLININDTGSKIESKGITSENIDGYSVSYGGTAQIEQTVEENIKIYLDGISVDGVPLLYAGGVNANERCYYPIS